ncbi:MAG: enoyl-CoA hydratase/isomerase family protein [Hyphomicrobiales bacterium]|nr:enoyl-CoA hydratase/isomerase family protein [Hyphomicrobiales bacterium]MCP5372995.1 enoyl-CoA hydratase/isomerase family protein [Hyphomicrobiales bacterium]
MASEGRVTIEMRSGGKGGDQRVAWILVDRQDRLNCMSTGQNRRLTEAVEQVGADDGVRAVVVTGAGGRSFIGGADLTELGHLDRAAARAYITGLHRVNAAIRACPVPVIARVNGFCLGGGLEVAASCDMRVASENAVFAMPEVHMGLPSVIEAALLPGLIGWGKTREMLLTGRTYDAAEALAMNFVERVVAPADLDAAVADWIDPICDAAPLAIRSQKSLITAWEDMGPRGGIAAGIDALADAYLTGEPQARIAAFFAAKGSKT